MVFGKTAICFVYRNDWYICLLYSFPGEIWFLCFFQILILWISMFPLKMNYNKSVLEINSKSKKIILGSFSDQTLILCWSINYRIFFAQQEPLANWKCWYKQAIYLLNSIDTKGRFFDGLILILKISKAIMVPVIFSFIIRLFCYQNASKYVHEF